MRERHPVWAEPDSASSSEERSIQVVVSVDVEEDSWRASRTGVTVENVRELPRLHSFLRALRIRPTYFTAYTVAATPWSAEIVRDLHAADGAEVGAHLHPWNTPPLREPLTPRNTMMCNLPTELQREKLEVLTDRLSTALTTRPRVFRAGRFGFASSLVPALTDLGYLADSSVTPFMDWTDYDGGPNYVGAPVEPYRIAEDRNARNPAPGGPLIELPVSGGFTSEPFRFWSRVHRVLDSGPLRGLRAWGAISRLDLARRVVLSPESESADDMLALTRRLVARGVGYLQLFFHSSSLRAGLSPFARTQGGVDRLYATIRRYVEALERMASVRFVTASEAASRPIPAYSEDPGPGTAVAACHQIPG